MYRVANVAWLWFGIGCSAAPEPPPATTVTGPEGSASAALCQALAALPCEPGDLDLNNCTASFWSVEEVAWRVGCGPKFDDAMRCIEDEVGCPGATPGVPLGPRELFGHATANCSGLAWASRDCLSQACLPEKTLCSADTDACTIDYSNACDDTRQVICKREEADQFRCQCGPGDMPSFAVVTQDCCLVQTVVSKACGLLPVPNE